MSCGSKSRLVESIWPNFTKIGPNFSKAKRKRIPRASFLERQKKHRLISMCSGRKAGRSAIKSSKRNHKTTHKITIKRK